VRGRAWQLYLAAGAALSLLFAAVPPFQGSGPLMNVLGLSPVLAIFAGMWLHRPASRAPWWCFAAAFTLFWLGDLYTIGYPRVSGHEVPFPSIGDAAYVLVYPVLMAGMLVLVRRRNPESDRAGLTDALIMTIGLSVLSWVGLIAPYLHDDELSVIGKLTSIAYPMGDILLLAAAIRLAVDGGRREPAFHLLTASIVALLATDFAYGLITLAGRYDNQIFLDLGWISHYLLWGACALHPSMATLDQPAPGRVPRLSRLRLGLLTGASLMAPVVLLGQDAIHGDVDLLVVVGAAMLLFALVVARMVGLVREQERAVDRERALSAAGAALVAASSREETHRALLEGARSIAGPDCGLELRVIEDGASRSIAAAPGQGGGRRELTFPLTVRGETLGELGVRTDRRLSRLVCGALGALATQMSLALESAALTEEVHQRRSEARFSSLIQHASDLITVLDRDGRIAYQSPSIEKVLGWRVEEVAGTSFSRLIADVDGGRLQSLLADGPRLRRGETEIVECSLRHGDGSVRQMEILYTDLLADEHVQGIVLNARDVSERRAFEEQLAHQAFHDPVTNLANRALFAERVRHAVARDRRDHEGVAVMFLDLDDFKTINDSLGHAAGDRVLVEVAQRLEASIRSSDTAARFGGDEFAVLLEGVSGVQEAAETATRILGALSLPVSLAEKVLSLRSSLGIALVEAGDAHAITDADELLRNADAAMYIAKRDGKGTFRLFEPAMHEGVLARLELRADLQRALTGDELALHYQPLVRLDDESVSGFEALLRWHHPERGPVPPADFVPFAEETGLIVPIGRWVLREGCRQAVELNRHSDMPLSMSVNLSVKQLQHSDIVADVREALDEAQLDPALLTLEITETVVMADTELAAQRLAELKALGVRLAMDDFGTGYSSLSYLGLFPVDVLKMDRSFLRSDATRQMTELASAVIAIGDSMHLDVVAEGIEHAEQARTLRELGCKLGQGYLFARPMDSDSAVAYLHTTCAARA
jgi:diguanylate cyclase (GGDEF)-like protein/PAS domain S-box-containing protein